MSDELDDLERQIAELRTRVRRAVKAKDSGHARHLRAELRRAERAWDHLVAGPAPDDGPLLPPLVPVREQVHQALTLLGVPAAPRLVVSVQDAFFGGSLRSPQLTSLRRDEERSFRSSPHARPYYLSAALTDRLSPARGLLAVSTWPMASRMVGPLSPRVHFLTSAERVAGRVGGLAEPPPQAVRLLARMARNIPGAMDGFAEPEPDRVARAALEELAIHQETDARQREELAARAVSQLGDVARLFGATTLSSVARKGASA